MRRYGRTRTKLAAMLEKALRDREGLPALSIEPEDFWLQQGDYRKATWDLASWGVDVHCNHQFFKVFSWDTMTDCVRYGFDILTSFRGEHWDREVSSRKP